MLDRASALIKGEPLSKSKIRQELETAKDQVGVLREAVALQEAAVKDAQEAARVEFCTAHLQKSKELALVACDAMDAAARAVVAHRDYLNVLAGQVGWTSGVPNMSPVPQLAIDGNLVLSLFATAKNFRAAVLARYWE